MNLKTRQNISLYGTFTTALPQGGDGFESPSRRRLTHYLGSHPISPYKTSFNRTPRWILGKCSSNRARRADSSSIRYFIRQSPKPSLRPSKTKPLTLFKILVEPQPHNPLHIGTPPSLKYPQALYPSRVTRKAGSKAREIPTGTQPQSLYLYTFPTPPGQPPSKPSITHKAQFSSRITMQGRMVSKVREIE